MLRAVLFDFNGLLVDDEPLHFRLFRQVLAEEGVDLTEADYYADYLGFDDRDCLTAALARAGKSAGALYLARLVARKAAYYQQAIRTDGYPFFAGAAALVRQAAEAGWSLGIVSGALRQEIEGALRQEGLARLLRVVVAADDVTRGKPDPEGYRLALSRLNAEPPLPARLIHPHEVVALEDSPAGLEAAAAAGLRTLGLAQTYPAAALAGAERVVTNVAEVSVAVLRRFFDGA